MSYHATPTHGCTTLQFQVTKSPLLSSQTWVCHWLPLIALNLVFSHVCLCNGIQILIKVTSISVSMFSMFPAEIVTNGISVPFKIIFSVFYYMYVYVCISELNKLFLTL